MLDGYLKKTANGNAAVVNIFSRLLLSEACNATTYVCSSSEVFWGILSLCCGQWRCITLTLIGERGMQQRSLARI